jgi:hypothetical protein
MTAYGFTGTRDGLTVPQRNGLRALLHALPPHSELHHGDCVGADFDAHVLAKAIGWRIISHPGDVQPALRADLIDADEIMSRRPALDRNVDIVLATSELIACPRTMQEEIRSGTWQAVRAARKYDRPVTIVWPSGECEREPRRLPGEDRLFSKSAAAHP